MVKLEPDKALCSYCLRSGLRADYVEAGPVSRNALKVFNVDAEAKTINRAGLFALLIQFHPENLALSPVINKENFVCAGHLCNPGRLKLTAAERRDAF